MAAYPSIVPYERQVHKLEEFQHLMRWFETIRAGGATVRAYDIGPRINPNPPGIRTDEEKKILFGQTASVVKS